MRRVIFTDPHIEESALEDLEKIFREIFKHEAEELIMIGDYFHKKHPNSQEIFWGASWASLFVRQYRKVVFVRGNHDKTKEISAIDYLKYLGVEVVDEYVDSDNNYYGHFMLHESKYAFGTGRIGKKDLKKYNNVFLGHQHSFQDFGDNIYHLGSVRYVGFQEIDDKSKKIAFLFHDLKFIDLESPIPMMRANSIAELENIPEKSKVRLEISSFEQFKKEINSVPKWKDKFIDFKINLNFTNKPTKEQTIKKIETKKLNDILREGIQKIEDKDVRELLLKQLEEK